MKKTKFMRAALLLLVLTLITSCFVGGTFAKYTTSAEGKDTARVAKFGVQITAEGTTFANEYDTDDTNVKATIAKSVVSTESTKKVVAPGTKGNMVAITISGTPEVAVEVKYDATVKVDNWTVDDAFYCPIEIKVGDETVKGLDYDNADNFQSAVKEKIDAYTKNYDAGTDLNNTDVKTPVVSWSWAFEGAGADAKQTDVKDTALGNTAANGTAATISVEVKTTVTQID